jgi:hypothetical protein
LCTRQRGRGKERTNYLTFRSLSVVCGVWWHGGCVAVGSVGVGWRHWNGGLSEDLVTWTVGFHAEWEKASHDHEGNATCPFFGPFCQPPLPRPKRETEGVSDSAHPSPQMRDGRPPPTAPLPRPKGEMDGLCLPTAPPSSAGLQTRTGNNVSSMMRSRFLMCSISPGRRNMGMYHLDINQARMPSNLASSQCHAQAIYVNQ